jgi:hypothetical protein
MYKINYSTKLYYYKFPYIVELEGNHWYHKPDNWENVYKTLKNMSTSWSDYDIVHRNTMRVYIKTKELFDTVVNNYTEEIISVTQPYNDNLDVLKDATKDLRASLYYNKYRYKISLTGHSMPREKIRKAMTKIHRPGDNRIYSTSSGWTHTLYTNAKHDIAKLTLMFGVDKFSVYKECKLFNEI